MRPGARPTPRRASDRAGRVGGGETRAVAAEMGDGESADERQGARHGPCASAALGGESARPHGAAGQMEVTMFDALDRSLKVLEQLPPIETAIRRRNAGLAKQLVRAAESVALNLAEGRGRRDGDQRRHYEMASGSAGELTAALRIAQLRSYITREQHDTIDADLDRVRAMLFQLTR